MCQDLEEAEGYEPDPKIFNECWPSDFREPSKNTLRGKGEILLRFYIDNEEHITMEWEFKRQSTVVQMKTEKCLLFPAIRAYKKER